jgi:hypothetical protein
MTEPIVWFGNFEFGEFVKSDDRFPCALIHDLQHQQAMTEEEADAFMIKHHYAGYLIPSKFDGEIYYSNGAIHD